MSSVLDMWNLRGLKATAVKKAVNYTNLGFRGELGAGAITVAMGIGETVQGEGVQ